VLGIVVIVLLISWLHVHPFLALIFGSALIAFASMAVIFLPLRRGRALTGRRLLVGGAFYLLYIAAVVVTLGGG